MSIPTTIFTSTGSTRFGCRFGRKGGSLSWVTLAIAYRRWQAWAAQWRSSGRDELLKHWNGTAPITQPPSTTITTSCALLSMMFRKGQSTTAWQRYYQLMMPKSLSVTESSATATSTFNYPQKRTAASFPVPDRIDPLDGPPNM